MDHFPDLRAWLERAKVSKQADQIKKELVELSRNIRARINSPRLGDYLMMMKGFGPQVGPFLPSDEHFTDGDSVYLDQNSIRKRNGYLPGETGQLLPLYDVLDTQLDSMQPHDDMKTVTFFAEHHIQALEQLQNAHAHAELMDKYQTVGTKVRGMLPSIDPEIMLKISDYIQKELTHAKFNETASFNSVFLAHADDGKHYVVKMCNDWSRAAKEAKAGMIANKHMPKGMNETPLFIDGMGVTVQEFTDLSQPFALKEFLTSLAEMHSYLTRNFTTNYELKIKSSDELRDQLLGKFATGTLENLLHMYTDTSSELRERKTEMICHRDLKRDNYGSNGNVQFVDWETIGYGHPVQDIALPLIQAGVGLEQWPYAADCYLQRLEQIDPHRAQVIGDNFKSDLYKFSIIPAITELGGLYSRPIGEIEQERIDVLTQFLDVYAKGNYARGHRK